MPDPFAPSGVVRITKTAALGAAIALTLALGGCGGSKSVKNTSATVTSSVSTTAAPAATDPGATAGPATGGHGTLAGSAYGYLSKVSLFGGPSNLRGFGQVVCTAPNVPDGCVPVKDAPGSASPSVTLPGAGGNVSQVDADGAKAQYGPATIFGGQQLPSNGVPPPSGPISVSSQGSVRPTASVTSSVDIVLFKPPVALTPGGVGPATFSADEVHAKCTATASGVTSSVTIVKGTLAISTTADGSPDKVVDVPGSPPANYTVTGDLTNVGDHYKYVYNEQVKNPDGSTTVNALHGYLLGPTAVGDLIIGHAVCGVNASGGAGA